MYQKKNIFIRLYIEKSDNTYEFKYFGTNKTYTEYITDKEKTHFNSYIPTFYQVLKRSKN